MAEMIPESVPSGRPRSEKKSFRPPFRNYRTIMSCIMNQSSLIDIRIFL